MAYTEARIAEVLTLLEANGGNLTATAKEAGVSKSTIKAWRDKKRGGKRLESSFDFVHQKRDELLALSENIALSAGKLLLKRLEETPDKVSTGDAGRIYGISTDKVQNLTSAKQDTRLAVIEEQLDLALQVVTGYKAAGKEKTGAKA